MLKKGSSSKVVGQNIKTEVATGKPKKQAIAIAMKKAGKSNKDKKPKAHKDEKKIFQSKDGITSRTVDGFDNFVSRIGLNNRNALSASTYVYNLVTRNRVLLEMAYRGSWIVGRVVDCVAKDMTRAGIDITTADTDGDEDLKVINASISRLKIWQSLCSGLKWGRLYGGAIAVVQIKGQDLKSPLNLDTIAEDQFQGLVIYDRWQVNPSVWQLIDSGPDLGLPEFYDITTDPRQVESGNAAIYLQTVHHSRVIRFTGIELPYFQAITEMMWGESVLERLWDRLISYDNAALSAASLIDRANLRTVQIDDFREIIAAGGEALEGLIAQFEMMREYQVNEGLTLLDKNDLFSSTSYSFAGLSDMLLQFAQQLSGSTETPLVILFGQSPSGLNSNGESDVRTYYDSINAKQESELRNAWELILKVLWRSNFGKAMPEDLEFKFRPLWQMSELDKVNVAKTATEITLGALENNAIDRATAMTELRDKSGETGFFNNITDEMINEAENEEPPMPDAAVSGGAGAPGKLPGVQGNNPITASPNDPAKKPIPSLDSKAKSWAKWILRK